jgi:hypothetical protein
MTVAPLASLPAPSTLAIVLRAVGALLAAYLLWTASRARSVSSEGSGFGRPAVVALAAAAFCVGWWATPVAPLTGPPAAQAAGVSLAAMAIVPLAGRDPLRFGAAMVVLVVALSVLLETWVGPASPLGQLVWTGLLVGATGATSLLVSHVAESKSELPMAIHSVAPGLAASIDAATAAASADGVTPEEPEPTIPVGPGRKTKSLLGARERRLRPRSER